jgi:hypothetical protein
LSQPKSQQQQSLPHELQPQLASLEQPHEGASAPQEASLPQDGESALHVGSSLAQEVSVYLTSPVSPVAEGVDTLVGAVAGSALGWTAPAVIGATSSGCLISSSAQATLASSSQQIGTK